MTDSPSSLIETVARALDRESAALVVEAAALLSSRPRVT
jgi:hypothetical protein